MRMKILKEGHEIFKIVCVLKFRCNCYFIIVFSIYRFKIHVKLMNFNDGPPVITMPFAKLKEQIMDTSVHHSCDAHLPMAFYWFLLGVGNFAFSLFFRSLVLRGFFDHIYGFLS